MRGADVLVEMLIRHGVKHIFGVPGDTSVAFHDALRLRQNDITHIICRDERDAAYSADAYARVTGKLGVVEVPSGGGALYVVPGISEANLSNIPLLCIASEINTSSEETSALTDCNQERLFAAVSKWNNLLKSPEKIPHMVRKAVRKSMTGVPGATALSFPENILREEYKGCEDDLFAEEYGADTGVFRNAPDPSDVDKLLYMIKDALRPVIIAGGGVHLSQAYEALEQFAETFAIPVVSSIDGKGSVSELSPYSLGTIGANGGSSEANSFTAEADLYIILGCKMDNVTSVGKRIIASEAKIVQVDLSEDILGNNVRVNLPVMADIRCTLEAVCRKYDGFDYKTAHTVWCAKAAEAVSAKFERIATDYGRGAERVVSAKIFESLEKYAGENTIFVGDAGTPTPYVASYIRLKKAGRYSIMPRAHGALGFALGAAIGAQIGRPDCRVVAAFGDASFGMAMGEIETIKRLKLPIIMVNFQNDCYGWIKTLQRLYYDGNYFGVDFSSVDSVKIAGGFGVKARNISYNDEIDEAIRWAYAQNAPVFLNVLAEFPEDFIPPVEQWLLDAAKPAEQRRKLVY